MPNATTSTASPEPEPEAEPAAGSDPAPESAADNGVDGWPETAEQARAMQDRLRRLVDTEGPGPAAVHRVAGLDVAYAEDSDRLAAAVVVLDARTLEVLERSVVLGHARFPYVPGLFAFRELPSLVAALDRLATPPDLLVCDGQGLAHPRRFGLACHLGVHTGIPSIGVGKTAFVGTYDTPPRHRGAVADLVLDGDVVGAVLRTQDDVKPVFVSVGHGLDLASACRHVLALSPRFRLPETTRQADAACRAALARDTAAALARDAVRAD